MYYVFFETGNDKFFFRIVEKFCSLFLKFVTDNYQDFLQEDGRVDMKVVENTLAKHKNLLTPLSCALFSEPPGHLVCTEPDCLDDHKTALALNQINKFEEKMKGKGFAAIAVAANAPKMTRFNIQRIFYHYLFLSIPNLEAICFYPVNNPNHKEYLRSYIKITDRLKDNADGFVYVRAPIWSDYGYFNAHTALPDVKPCDSFSVKGVL